MLFKVELDVVVPHNVDPEAFNKLKAQEKEYAQKLQRKGVLRHIWRIAGQYKAISIFDVASSEELHETLNNLPLYPFLNFRVEAIIRHPSSIHEDDR